MTVDELRNSRDKAQVAFHEFMIATSEYPNYLFCFFEGKDNPYYVPRIKRFTSLYIPIKCGGRDKVLKVRSLIANRQEYTSYRKAFFIDRDFNEALEPLNPPVFETPCYSVENLYTSVDVFKDILINEFHLSEFSEKEIFEKCISLYQERQDQFHDASCLFNAWYACLIEIRNSTGTTTGVNLEEKWPKGFINLTLDAVTCNYNFETIKNTFPNATEIEQDILTNKLNEFNNCEKRKVFRGKYEMYFLLRFIELLLRDNNTNKSVIKSKVQYAFGDNLSNQQAINVFEGYAETPDELIEYLQTVMQ